MGHVSLNVQIKKSSFFTLSDLIPKTSPRTLKAQLLPPCKGKAGSLARLPIALLCAVLGMLSVACHISCLWPQETRSLHYSHYCTGKL